MDFADIYKENKNFKENKNLETGTREKSFEIPSGPQMWQHAALKKVASPGSVVLCDS